jgi:hypothetical protein
MTRIALNEANVKAMLSGATELRVVVKPQPKLTESPFRSDHLTWWVWKTDVKLTTNALTDNLLEACPYPVGSLVALTETWHSNPSLKWARLHQVPFLVVYKADDDDDPPWLSPATMPAEFSRFKRRVAGVRVEHGELWEWVLSLEAM